MPRDSAGSCRPITLKLATRTTTPVALRQEALQRRRWRVQAMRQRQQSWPLSLLALVVASVVSAVVDAAPISASVQALSALPSNVLALLPMVSVRGVANFVAVAAFPEQLLAVVAVAELPVHEAAVVAVAALPVHASAVVAAPPGDELPA